MSGETTDGREGAVVLYTTEDGRVAVNAVVKEETLWMTQRGMAEVFGVGTQAITKHLKNVFESGELREEATCSKMEQVRNEGGRKVRRMVEFYSLDAIIAVGYRVNSFRATQFRIWATGVLREYIVKGFALDDRRLKRGGQGGWEESALGSVVEELGGGGRHGGRPAKRGRGGEFLACGGGWGMRRWRGIGTKGMA